MKHNPTRQHHGMYESLNEKGANHAVPHKELNAMSSELDKSTVHYSHVTGNINAKSPVQIYQINGFKSNHGNLESRPMTSNTFGYSDGDFLTKQIPNTHPKEPHTSSTKGPMKTMHHSSKSNIFHA